ncbi:MAG TPA: class I SAM-dependent methyltransferase [Anaerolineales bacterium]
MKAGLEACSCPLCGGNSYKPAMQVPDRFASDGGMFQIVRCSHCEFFFLNPRPSPESMSAYYQNPDYQPFLSTKESPPVWDRLYGVTRRFTIPAKRRQVEKYKKIGRVLDIGCGTGEFLVEMKQHGWQIAGLEKDARAAGYASRQTGVSITTSDLADAGYEPASFDLVTMWHVLEHLYTPAQTLRQIAALLKADGVLAVAMPNIGSQDAAYYKSEWVPLDAPRHLLHFTPAAMRRLCEQSGLQVVHHQQMVIDALYNCLMSEKFIASRRASSLPAFLVAIVRALAVASASVLNASAMTGRAERQGSSVLYFIIKQSG